MATYNHYSELPDLTATTLATGRTYETPHGAFPSITTILGKTGNKMWLERWKQRVGEEEAARISKIATDRGTNVHSYLERHWNKEDIIGDLSKEPLDTIHMVRSLIDVTTKNIQEVHAQEIALWSPTLKCAGRVDKVCNWLGEDVILDYKTAKKPKNLTTDIKDYRLQICFYRTAHNELFPNKQINKGVIVIAVDGKSPQVILFDCRPYQPELIMRINEYYKNFSN
jgi:ATP-dependent exoDNAse (exonuclease V) beta subunit